MISAGGTFGIRFTCRKTKPGSVKRQARRITSKVWAFVVLASFRAGNEASGLVGSRSSVSRRTAAVASSLPRPFPGRCVGLRSHVLLVFGALQFPPVSKDRRGPGLIGDERFPVPRVRVCVMLPWTGVPYM